MKVLHHRPELDGLRGVAIVPAVLFHAGAGVDGGYVGVDVFFVLSGFLITSILLREIDGGTFSLPRFWARRVRRIVPAAALVLACSWVAGLWILPPAMLENLGSGIWLHSVLASNYYAWSMEGYFVPTAETLPLLHTWSLALEEQFYLLFPLLLWMLRRMGGAGRVSILSIACIGSFAVGWYATFHYPSAAYYSLPTRGWELGLGAVLAAWPRPPGASRPLREAGSWLGLLVVVASALLFGPETPFPGAAALLPCLATVLLIRTNEGGRTTLGRALSWKPIAGLGLISYSLYLWHWPVLVFGRYLLGPGLGASVTGILILSSVGLSLLTWRFVEQPSRRLGLEAWGSRILWGGAVLLALLAVMGRATVRAEGFPDRYSRQELASLSLARRDSAAVNDSLSLLQGHDLSVVGAPVPAEPGREMLLWGDSHARQLTLLLEKLGEARGVTIHAAISPGATALRRGTAVPSPPVDPALYDAIVGVVRERSIPHAVLVARWESYAWGLEATRSDPRGPKPGYGPDGSPFAAFADELRQTVRDLQAAGAKVWILKQIPRQPPSLGVAIAFASRALLPLPEESVSVRDHLLWNREVNDLIDSLTASGVGVLDPLPLLSDGYGATRIQQDGIPLYSDPDHLSTLGAEQLRTLFEPFLETF